MNRRKFLEAAGAAALMAGCRTAPTDCGVPSLRPSYKPELRDRFWTWGHHPATLPWNILPQAPGNEVLDLAEANERLGVPNVVVVRWRGYPRAPFDDYVEQFRSLRRVAWSVVDSAKEPFDWKLRTAFDLKESGKLPNLTTLFFDDYFHEGPRYEARRLPLPRLREVKRDMAARGLSLASVLYADTNGLHDKYKPALELCDEVSYWFWHRESIDFMEDSTYKCREFVGSEKSLLLGLYMWQFGKDAPMPAESMRRQLAVALKLLREGVVDGLVFHSTFLVGLGLDAIAVSRDWIVAHGDEKIKG